MSTPKITDLQWDILRLIKRSIKEGEWAQANKLTWPLLQDVPQELIVKDENTLRVRFSEEGRIIMKWVD